MTSIFVRVDSVVEDSVSAGGDIRKYRVLVIVKYTDCVGAMCR